MKARYFSWVIVFILFLLDLVSYIDRSAIAYAVPLILIALHIKAAKMGLILGAFGIGYFITTLTGGFLADRLGPRLIFLIFSLLWAVAMVGTALMASFVAGYCARFALGFGEGPFSPAIARTFGNWLSPVSRGKALSNTLCAVPASLAIGAPICTTLILALGWRWMFGILSMLIGLWWLVCLIFFADTPQQSRFVSDSRDITDTAPKVSYQRYGWQQWRILLKNKTVLSNCWGFFTFGFLLFFLMTWLPYFLQQAYHLDLKQIGLFAFLPWAVAAMMLWLVGYLSDFIYTKTNCLRYARSYPIILGQLLSLLCIVPIIVWHQLTITLIFMVLAVGFSLSNNTCFYATNIDIQKSHSGGLLGIMNAGFALSGFIAPSLAGYLVQHTGSFHSVFYLIIGLTLSSVLFALFCHRPDQDILT